MRHRCDIMLSMIEVGSEDEIRKSKQVNSSDLDMTQPVDYGRAGNLYSI